MPFVVGESIGPYRILEKLGRGGMATVYKGYHAALDRYVAIKALHPAFMEDPNFLARFQREARVVAKLEHPNIVPVYDFSEHEGRPYLVMKFIEGETLKARLSRGPISQEELLHVIEAVGDALAYAHQKGILHRDVKPSNVLLGYDDRIYLADFGLARIAQMGESTLSSDKMLGTPQYMSPEQAKGIKELDEGTDIYSFGVMLYELTVGQVPFSADTPFSVIHDHIYTPLPLPRRINPEVPEPVERVLLKALSKERADRYPDARALVDAFRQAILDEDIPSVPVIESQVVSPQSENIGKVDSAPAEPTSSSASTLPPVTPSAPVELPKTETKKRRFRWWQILLAVILLCLCGVLALGAFSRWQERAASRTEENTPTALQEDILGEISIVPEEPLARGGQLSSDIQDALDYILENPNDPYGYLDLADLYWENQDYQQVGDALKKAVDLAQGDFDVLLEITNLLAERGRWVESANLFLNLKLNYPDEFDEYLEEDFRHTMYMASRYPEALDMVPLPEIAKVDSPLERVTKARYLFHNGQPDEARALVEEITSSIKPGMAEAILLQVEISMAEKDYRQAERLTEELESRQDVSDWILDMLDSLWENEEPWMHVQYLGERMDAGDFVGAEDEMTMVMDLAGDNPDIYYAAAEVLIQHEAWVYAAPLYITSAKLSNPPSKEVLERIEMSVYYGASDPNALDILLQPDLGLDPGILQIVEARYALYQGEMAEAEGMIRALVENPPDLFQEKLLEAELYVKSGDKETAARLLNQIQNEETNPTWIREEARATLEEINR